MNDHLSAPAALREVNQRYAGGKGRIGYHRFWQGIAAGSIPALRVNGRYQIAKRDLPRIAATLGLVEAK